MYKIEAHVQSCMHRVVILVHKTSISHEVHVGHNL